MTNQNTWIFSALALILGVLVGALVFPTTNTVTETVTVPVPGETKIITETNTELIADANLFLEQAIQDAWSRELSDDDDFLTCDSENYDEDEVEISKIYEWSYSWLDEDEYSVDFKAKYKFDSTNDDDRCTATRTISVFYEDGEKPVINWN